MQQEKELYTETLPSMRQILTGKISSSSMSITTGIPAAVSEPRTKQAGAVLSLFSCLIPFVKNKAIFDCVGLATNFWSSLAPCPSAMVARSRRKNLCCLLVQYGFIFYEWLSNSADENFGGTEEGSLFHREFELIDAHGFALRGRVS